MLCLCVGAPACTTTSNVMAFEMAKVHLGMTPDEAIAALSAEAVGKVEVDKGFCYDESAATSKSGESRANAGRDVDIASIDEIAAGAA